MLGALLLRRRLRPLWKSLWNAGGDVGTTQDRAAQNRAEQIGTEWNPMNQARYKTTPRAIIDWRCCRPAPLGRLLHACHDNMTQVCCRCCLLLLAACLLLLFACRCSLSACCLLLAACFLLLVVWLGRCGVLTVTSRLLLLIACCWLLVACC